jgi:S-adenosylmethionine hydrolase
MPDQTAPSSPTVLAFLTDFGLSDGYAGVMKGVVMSIAPQVCMLDITHDIAPQDIASARWILATTYSYFPAGTIFVCVVDPGVGSARRPVALHVGKWYFVGPDNGLFSYVLAQQPVHAAVALTNPAYHLPQVSHTFHGRDIFSPAAAHIARGVALSELGPTIDPADLQRLSIDHPIRQNGQIAAQVAHIDHFGNIITNIPLHMVPDLFEHTEIRLHLPQQGITIVRSQRFFATGPTEQSDNPFVYGDSSEHIAVAIRNGNAAKALGVTTGAPVSLLIGS